VRSASGCDLEWLQSVCLPSVRIPQHYLSCVLLLASVPIGQARFGLGYRYWASNLIHYAAIFGTAPSELRQTFSQKPSFTLQLRRHTMYQSLFGFQNRDAQLRAAAAKQKPTQSICLQQCLKEISSNSPPPYTESPSKQQIDAVMASDDGTTSKKQACPRSS
jgi:hypothetical protein